MTKPTTLRELDALVDTDPIELLRIATELWWENEHSSFMIDYMYDALGPANDDIMEMAEEAWDAEKAKYPVED